MLKSLASKPSAGRVPKGKQVLLLLLLFEISVVRIILVIALFATKRDEFIFCFCKLVLLIAFIASSAVLLWVFLLQRNIPPLIVVSCNACSCGCKSCIPFIYFAVLWRRLVYVGIFGGARPGSCGAPHVLCGAAMVAEAAAEAAAVAAIGPPPRGILLL